MSLIIPSYAGLQKPIYPRINKFHPLVNGLTAVFLLNETSGEAYNLLDSSFSLSLVNSGGWTTGPQGPQLNTSLGNDSGAWNTAPPLYMKPSQQVSILWQGSFVGSPGADSTFAGMPYTTSDTAPFFSYIINMFGSGQYRGAWNNDGAIGDIEVSPNVSFNDPSERQLLLTVQTGIQAFYENGVQIGSQTNSFTNINYAADTHFDIGIYQNGIGRNNNTKCSLVYVWNRALTSYEARILAWNPYVIFQDTFLHTVGRLLGGVLPATSINGTPPLAVGASAYYKLDENTGGNVKDELNTYPGTWRGDLSNIWKPGIINSGGNFNGANSFVAIPSAIIDITKNYTVSFWVQGFPQTDFKIFMQGSSSTGTPVFNIATSDSDNTKLRLFIRDDAGGGGVSASTTLTVFDNTLKHIVLTGAGGVVKVYVNGVLDPNSGAFNYTPTTITLNQTALGCQFTNGTNNFFTGIIDEVGVWNRTLSQDEALQLYNNGWGKQFPFLQYPVPTLGPYDFDFTSSNWKYSLLHTIGRLRIGNPIIGTIVSETEQETSQIIVDKVFQGQKLSQALSTVTLTMDISIPSPDAILVVTGGSVIATGAPWASVQFNGNSLTKLVQTGVANQSAEIWYLPYPSVGTGQLLITSGTGGEIYANAMVILGVDKKSTNITTASATDAASTAVIGALITPDAPNSLIIDTLSTLNATTFPVQDASQTQVFNASALASNEYILSTYKIASAQQNMNYNLAIAVNASLVAVSFRPAQAASIWFPNIDFRQLDDVVTVAGLDAEVNPAFGQYGYKASAFYLNSFLHTIGRNLSPSSTTKISSTTLLMMGMA